MEEKRESSVDYGRWIAVTLSLTVVILCIFSAVTIYIDPLFHYHGPLTRYEYPIYDERYQNDGIIRNFEYNGLITGTSMTQNFKTSEAEAIFGVPFVKVPFSGATYKEINDNLKRGFQAGKRIDYVIRGLYYGDLCSDKDIMRYDGYPAYLYNDNPFDDVYYTINKTIFLNKTREVLRYTENGMKTTTFDEYNNWNALYTFGADSVLNYTLPPAAETPVVLTEEDGQRALENIRQNITDLADEHPETTFYLFFTPFSICFWDIEKNAGRMDTWIDYEQIAIEEMLKHPNIRLFCFFTNFEMICDLNNYKDSEHYGEWINSWMLEQMYNGNYLLTEDNYMEHLASMREFYNSYDYASLHRQ